MSALITCQSIAKSFHHHPLFTGITLGIEERQIVGIIGPNGAGKSTFLKLLAGMDKPDAGQISRRRDITVRYVQQQDKFPAGSTPRSVLAAAMKNAAIAPVEQTTRVNRMISQLAFATPDAECTTMSGGWRKRLAIAEALIVEPDLLLLDEPTNHLDLEGILWLEKLLSRPGFAALVITHDRYFLDNVTARIIEINRAFPGGFFSADLTYSDFLEKREEFLAGQASQESALANRMRREATFLHGKAKAQRRKSKFRKEAAGEMMEELSELRERNAAADRQASISFSATDRKTVKLLDAKKLSYTIGERTLFSDVDLLLTPKSRFGLLGMNGSGKSTLLKVLIGTLPSTTGTVKRADNLKVVFFDQQRAALDLKLTLRQALSPDSDQVIFRGMPMHVTAWAQRFLFSTDQLQLPLSALSGGEQSRVLIARLMLQPADVLILDEPTNDLDIPTLDILEENLDEFPGAVVMVTHDRYMLERLSTDLLWLDNKGGHHWFTDLDQWERAQEQAQAATKATKPQAEKPQTAAEKAASATRPDKRLTYMEQREWERIESDVAAAEEALNVQRDAIDAAVHDPAALMAACHALENAQGHLDTLYARWEYLAAKREGN